jgi:hemerythrin-like domain-containing protein
MTAALNGDDLPAFVHCAEEYVALLRQHILKESNMLLVLAAGLLSVEDHKHLILAFKQHDQAAPVCRKHLVREMVRWASALAAARRRQTERAAKESLQARPRAAAMR